MLVTTAYLQTIPTIFTSSSSHGDRRNCSRGIHRKEVFFISQLEKVLLMITDRNAIAPIVMPVGNYGSNILPFEMNGHRSPLNSERWGLTAWCHELRPRRRIPEQITRARHVDQRTVTTCSQVTLNL